MAESEGIKEIVNEAAIQSAIMETMAFRDVDVGSPPISTASLRK